MIEGIKLALLPRMCPATVISSNNRIFAELTISTYRKSQTIGNGLGIVSVWEKVPDFHIPWKQGLEFSLDFAINLGKQPFPGL